MGWRKLLVRRKVRSGHLPGPAPPVPIANRRRSHRVSAFLPVFIYAHSHNEPFIEHAVTLNVSACGGLLSLSRDVEPSQELLIANTQTDEEMRCRIARVTKTQAGTVLVGFEFLRPAPRFWSIEFSS
jgi:c-di-GMP-binding flagellar brake protein YcgR